MPRTRSNESDHESSGTESTDFELCSFRQSALSITVMGASGDLAKKKTYPSLFALYASGFLPKSVIILGYARSSRDDEQFRKSIAPYLKGDESTVSAFLQCCIYRHGQYGDVNRLGQVYMEVGEIEAKLSAQCVNRLFYFAIPPSIFVSVARALKLAAVDNDGWNRFIIEKPFGRDLASFEQLNTDISQLLDERDIYRIDHYLGKEMVANIMVLRFANATFEPLWNRQHISSVTITFKEDFGTKGRGGYFDKNGIIRDVCQNHLMQILAILAMEPPVTSTGDHIRDEKVKVLQCIDPIEVKDCICGQYTRFGKEPGYTEDEGVPDDSITPTFATMVLYIKNARWDGVPFILRAGKALNERKSEVRIQFHAPPGSSRMFPGMNLPRNELVMRVQPDEAVYMKTLVKKPGLSGDPIVSELDLSYRTRFQGSYGSLPDAYTRLILQTLIGDSSSFVREDELREAWRIFTPLLHAVDDGAIEPILYKFGSRGPKEGDKFTQKLGYVYSGSEAYSWPAKM